MGGRMDAKDRIVAVEYWNDVSAKLQAVVDNSVEELEEAVQVQVDSPPLLDIKNSRLERGGCDRVTEAENQIISSEDYSIQSSHAKSGREGGGDQSYQLIVSTHSLGSTGVNETNIGNPKSQQEAVVIGNQRQTLLIQERNLEEWHQVQNGGKDQTSMMLLQDVKAKRQNVAQEQTSLLLRDIRRDPQQSLLLERRPEQVIVNSRDVKAEHQHSLLHRERKPEQQSLLLQRPPLVLADKENHGEENQLNLKDEGFGRGGR